MAKLDRHSTPPSPFHKLSIIDNNYLTNLKPSSSANTSVITYNQDNNANHKARRRYLSNSVNTSILFLGLILIVLPSLVASSATYLSYSGGMSGSHTTGGGIHQLLASSSSSSSLLALPALLPMNEFRTAGSKNEPPSRPSVDWSNHRPHFGNDIQKNVSVELGKTAFLTCKVYELGDRTVSWLRLRENEILTVGQYTYISDSRFSSINIGTEWSLQIKDVTMNDSTNYECQISTDPKMSMIISLQVKATKATIKQGDSFYGVVGSNIELQCDATPASTATTNSPIYVYWYHNGNLLNYIKDNLRNISIIWDANKHSSKLRINNAQLSDAGNYSCKPSSAEPATTRLHLRKNIQDEDNDKGYYHIRHDGRATNGLVVRSDSQTSSSPATPISMAWVTSLYYLPFCIIYIHQFLLLLS